jgi:multiple sugar transport system permease protein
MAKLREKSFGIIGQFDLRKRSVRILYYVIFAISLICVFVAIAPALWLVLNSFRSFKEFQSATTLLPSKFEFGQWVDAWNAMSFVKYYLNSLIVVAGSIISAIVFNGLLAYSLAMIKPKGHKVVNALVLWSLMIPATTSLVPLFVNIKKAGMVGTFWPLWLAIGANAFYVTLYKNFYESLPFALIEAARLDGCSDLQIFFRIVVPLSGAINVVVIMYAVNAAWSDFLLPQLVLNGSGKETVMVKLYELNNQKNIDRMKVLRAVTFSIIPPVILFIIFQKQITEGVALSGIKG